MRCIFTKDVTEFINAIPLILTNVIFGFIFISVFRLVVRHKYDANPKALTISSIAMSFILKLVFDAGNNLLYDKTGVWLQPNTFWYYVIFIVFTVLLAYGIGRMVDANWFDKVLQRIGIDHTIRPTIWDDLIQDGTAADIRLKTNPDIIYHGEVKLVEEDVSEPTIALCYYNVIDGNTNKCLKDYTYDANKVFVTSYKNILQIQFNYHK